MQVDRLVLKTPVRLGPIAKGFAEGANLRRQSRPAVAGPTHSRQRVPPVRARHTLRATEQRASMRLRLEEETTVKTWNLAPFLGGAPFQARNQKS